MNFINVEIIIHPYLKFMFSKKATKIVEIFTVDLTVTTYISTVKLTVKILSIFVAFSENVNFTVYKVHNEEWFGGGKGYFRHPSKLF